MGARRTFALPDLGEGLAEGEVLAWLVDVGDVVTLNQPLVEVETAKAAVELPSPYAGRVAELHARAGETVDVGAPLVTLEEESEERQEERQAVLVGYGPGPSATTRRPRRHPQEETAPAARSAGTDGSRVAALAAPPVRRKARDLGLDLTDVQGTGPGGIITRDDLDRTVRERDAAARPAAGAGERRIPVTGVRKATAAAMVRSAFTAPHATVFLTVDATATCEALERLARRPELDGLPVGPLLLTAKAVLLALRRHPEVNARWDEAAQEIVVLDSVALGVAAATPRGLLVPNVQEADRLLLPDLARALADLTATARAGRTPPEALRGGTFTITNVGVFGVDAGTPILNPGEAAILCLGAVRPMPWVHEGEVAVRQVVQLALSFDHRLVDGELASRFLADVGALLHDPALAIAWC